MITNLFSEGNIAHIKEDTDVYAPLIEVSSNETDFSESTCVNFIASIFQRNVKEVFLKNVNVKPKRFK